MRRVVFLRGVNVGKGNRCRPAMIASQLSQLGVINIGAVGTFVVCNDVNESALRRKFAVQLAKTFGVKCEIMICPARSIIELVKKDPFANQPSDSKITRFVNVLSKRLTSPPLLPLCFPSDKEWLLKVIAIDDRFVLGLYRREMKAIGYLGKVEKFLGVPATTRNWNTIQKVVKILESHS